jgi:hypothetical protein
MIVITPLTLERHFDCIQLVHTPWLGIYGVAFVERHTYGVQGPELTQPLPPRQLLYLSVMFLFVLRGWRPHLVVANGTDSGLR